jgi:DNA-binding GntR family transcriptional regulator
MELIDRENHQKLYIQLYEIIKKKIENNEWTVGSQIPTEQELCNMFNVSRVTVRTAILELVRHGFLRRQQGKGTFICQRAEHEGLTMSMNFREFMLEEGFTFSTDVLARTVMMPLNSLDIRLDIQEDRHIIYIKKLVTVDDEPVLLQEAYIPYHICPLLLEEDVKNISLIELFEKKFGIKITRIKNHIGITQLKPDEGKLLRLSEGSAAILLTQQIYSGDTQIMYARSVKGSDKIKFLIDLERKAA